jgi:hypothetical protein
MTETLTQDIVLAELAGEVGEPWRRVSLPRGTEIVVEADYPGHTLVRVAAGFGVLLVGDPTMVAAALGRPGTLGADLW